MFLAWKELKHNKTRYALIMMILILVVFLVLFLAGLAKGLSAATSATIDNANANYYVLDDSSDKLIPRSSLSEEQLSKINEFTEDVTPIDLQRSTVTKDSEDTKLDITYLALDSEDFMMPKVVKGDSLNNANEIILNESFKDDGFKIGDKITDTSSNVEMTVVGFTKDQMYGHSSVGVISLDTFHNMQIVSTGKEDVSYQAFAISTKATDTNEDLIKNYLASDTSLKNTVLLSKSDIISNIPGHSQEQATILMMLVFLLVISSFIIGVFFYVTTMQKLPQFGVLKALGSKMSTLSWSLICQVFILSAISMVIGNILTFGLASMLPPSMPFVLTYGYAASISLLFLIISLLSSLFSMGKIRKVDAISAIGGNE